ncbi:MAG: MFS family permease [Parasphingorhabdus sp.]
MAVARHQNQPNQNCQPTPMKALLINIPLGHMANDWAPGALWILMPAIAVSMGLSPSEVGLLITIHYVGAAIGYLPAGILADRVANQGRLLTMTFWWVAVGYLLASQVEGFWPLAILLAIAGMGDAAWHPIATGVLVNQMPKRRGMVLGIHAMGGTMAEVGAPLAAGFMLSYFDWRTALQFSVIPAVIMGVVFLYFSRSIPLSKSSAVSSVELSRIARHWLKPKGITLAVKISLYNMSLMALMSMTPLYLQNDLSYSAAFSGIVFAAAMLLGSLLQPVIGRYSDKKDRQHIFIGGSLLVLGFCLIASFSNNPALTIASLVLAMAILVSIRSSVLASAVEYASTRAATTLGFVFVMLDGVGALGALAAGRVGEINLQSVFLLAAGFALGSMILSLLLLRGGPKITQE